MGYDIHLTRARDWADSLKQPISEAEWWSYVRADPELDLRNDAAVDAADETWHIEWSGLAVWRRHPSGDTIWFEWDRGQVTIKNPDDPALNKAIAVARRLNARVVGDDGEVYESDGHEPQAALPSLADRWAAWKERWRPRRATVALAPPFRVGDRVYDPRGQTGEVVDIDLAAEHGLGIICVRMDDGLELRFSAVAHGLSRPGPRAQHGRAHE